MDYTSPKSWRLEGGSGRFPRSSLHRSHSNTWPDEGRITMDPELQRRVHFAQGTVSGSHIPLVPKREREDDDERPGESVWGGEYLKSMVYGGLDAIVTCFALVASVSGGQYPAASVLILGCANLIADGLSMGFGDYLSSSSEQAYAANRKEITDWEFRNNMQEQVMNLVSIYEAHGMERNDAEHVVAIFTKYNDMLSTAKMVMEDGLLPPDEDESPLKNGVVTFLSFLAFGSTPLLSFALLNPITQDIRVKFSVACVVTAFALVLLGVAKAKISGEKYSRAVLIVVTHGGVAAIAAYCISYGLEKLSGTG